MGQQDSLKHSNEEIEAIAEMIAAKLAALLERHTFVWTAEDPLPLIDFPKTSRVQ